MPYYAGSPVLIATTAKGFDDEVLTQADVIGLQVSVYDNTGTVQVLAPQTMTWNELKLRWQYEWDTTGIEPGTYKAQVELIGEDNLPTPDFIRIRLAKLPVTPPIAP